MNMTILPSILIAGTLISGTGGLAADLPAGSLNTVKNQCIISIQPGDSLPGNIQELLSCLKDYGIWNFCPDIELPDTDAPDVELPDVDVPDTDAPDVELPDTDVPDTDAPDTDVPDTDVPDTDVPDAGLPTPSPDDTPEDNTPDFEQDTNQSYVEQVVALVNAERAKVNLPALTMSTDLNRAAQIRARETVQSFSHTRPNGSSFSSVLRENGISYRGSGENIAWGQRTPEAVVNAWMNSSGHRANILNSNFTSIGIGYYLNGSTPYWTQLFTY